MANNIKKFLCTFSNGMQAIMGADSAKDNILGNNPMLNAGNDDIEPDPDFF